VLLAGIPCDKIADPGLWLPDAMPRR
jgi:hypothetical protein